MAQKSQLVGLNFSISNKWKKHCWSLKKRFWVERKYPPFTNPLFFLFFPIRCLQKVIIIMKITTNWKASQKKLRTDTGKNSRTVILSSKLLRPQKRAKKSSDDVGIPRFSVKFVKKYSQKKECVRREAIQWSLRQELFSGQSNSGNAQSGPFRAPRIRA